MLTVQWRRGRVDTDPSSYCFPARPHRAAGGDPQCRAGRPGAAASGIGVRVLEAEAADLPLPPEVELVEEATPQCLDGCELLIVLGGDGTLLRGAEFARGVRGADARRQPRAASASSPRPSGTTSTRSSTGW